MALLLNMVVCCALQHNLLLGQSAYQVENLLEVLEQEGMVPDVNDDSEVYPSMPKLLNNDFKRGDQK